MAKTPGRKGAAAKRAPPPIDDEPASSPQSVPKAVERSAFEALIKTIVKHKAEAKDWNGLAGKATQLAAENSGLNARVVTICANLYRQEPAKRTSFVADLMAGLNALGFLDEGTLFDTPRKQASTVVQSTSTLAAPPPPEDTAEDAEAAQVASNVHHLKGIKQLEGADAPSSYKVN